MKRLFLPLIVAAVLSTGFIGEPSGPVADMQKKAREHRFRVGKLNNAWKVHDRADAKNRVIRASRGDKVIWAAEGSDLFFQFPDQTVFGMAEASVADGKELALTVAPNAKSGRYTYSIFCAREKKFATGDSPPVIIIQ